jgi:hypothetical protein
VAMRPAACSDWIEDSDGLVSSASPI